MARRGGDGAGSGDLNLLDGLVQLTFTVQRLVGEAGADAGMSPVQMRLLGMLRGRRPTMAAIAAHLHLDKSSVTGLVDRAERRGLVERTTSPDDGRSVLVGLTPAGTKVIGAVGRELEHRVAELTDGLSPTDVAHLTRIATRLVAAAAEAQ